jgi:hypothetical protein
LAEQVARRNISHMIVSEVRFSAPMKQELLHNWEKVMQGPVPHVFVNGKAKASPSLDQIVEEISRLSNQSGS